MRVLLTGATGFIGQHVCRRFVERGDGVVALVRSPEKAAKLGGNVTLLKRQGARPHPSHSWGSPLRCVRKDARPPRGELFRWRA